jgi:hypothetical protein
MALWRGSDDWAERRASRELLNFWAGHGGRLSWARWQSEQAAQARAYRDERGLAKLAAVVGGGRECQGESPGPVSPDSLTGHGIKSRASLLPPATVLAGRADAMVAEMRARVDTLAARMLAELRGVVT